VAVRRGDGWVINGSKTFITQGSVGDVFVVLASTDAAKRQKGITAFVVEKGARGFSQRALHGKLGMRSSDTAELTFEEVVVPDDARVGRLDHGFIDTLSILDRGRISIASLALGLGMLGIFLYVTLRFEFSFAVGAIVALLHDVLITVGAFALFGRELSLVTVGAILTIGGYSINDTIVVFDRIRETVKSGRPGSLEQIMNISVNEMLGRTFLTSAATLIPTIGLFAFGGPVLRDFAFAILVGVITGTYSSVFIAAPIVLWWSKRGGRDLRSELKKGNQTVIPA